MACAGALTLAVAMGIGRFIYTPILPAMIEAQVLNRSEAGLVASFNYVGYLLGAMAASLSLLGGNRKVWLLAALIANAATTYLMARTETLMVFHGLRFASGVTSAFAMIFVSSMVFDAIARSGKDWLLAVHFSGVGLGIAASALFVPLVAGWQDQWALGGVVSGLGLVVVAVLIQLYGRVQAPTEPTPADTDPDSQAMERGPDRQNAIARTIRLLIVGYGLFGFGYVITATFISELARSVPQLSHLKDIIWFYVGISAVFSTLICTLFSKRFGLLLTFSGACLVEAVGVAASVLFDHPLALILSALLLGGTFVGATAIGLMAASRLSAQLVSQKAHSDLGRKIIALMTVSFGLGQVLGPWLAGFLFHLQGDLFTASFCAVLALLISGGLTLRAYFMHPL